MRVFTLLYANDNDALVPERWAAESIAILEENMVAGQLVHRDFENEIAMAGDVVNTRKPGEFTAARKVDTEDVTVQDASSTNVQVPLDQHLHTSFVIKDGEESKSFKSLVEYYLQPAVLSIAQAIDRIVCGQSARWIFSQTDGIAGVLGTAPTDVSTILAARNVLNKNKAYVAGRNLLLTPDTETALLAIDTFNEADKVGDQGTALREASLGRKLGFNTYMCQNMPIGVAPSSGTYTYTATTLSAAAAKGATTVTVTSASNMAAGQIMLVAGDPQVIHAVNSTTISIWPGLRRAAASGAAASVYNAALVNYGSGYAAGYHKAITIDTMTGLSVGQPVLISPATSGTGVNSSALAAAAKPYTIIAVPSATTIILDRPLDVALVDNSTIMLPPPGNYNFAFHRNAIALVTRPLVLPRAGTGALAGVASYNGLSIRVVMQYEGRGQGHLVTVDTLCGVAKLDDDLGTILLG